MPSLLIGGLMMSPDKWEGGSGQGMPGLLIGGLMISPEWEDVSGRG